MTTPSFPQSFTISPEAVSFIKNDFTLIQLIIEAAHNIWLYFPEAPMHLSIITDPETEISEKLLLSIITNMDLKTAQAKLTEFDQKWWFDNMHIARNKLCIDVSFIHK